MSKHVGVIICEIFVHLLVVVQNKICKDVFLRVFTYANTGRFKVYKRNYHEGSKF